MNSTSIFNNILSSSLLKPLELILRLSITSFMLHQLSTNEYGLITTTISLLAGVGAFSSLGLDRVISVQMHREKNLQSQRFLIRKALAFRFLVCAVIALFYFIFFPSTNKPLLYTSIFLFISESMSGICSSILITFFHLKTLSILRIGLMSAQFLFLYYCSIQNLSWEYYLASCFIQPFCLFIFQLYLLQKRMNFLKKEPLIYAPKFSNLKSSYGMEVSDYLLGKQSDTVLLASYISHTYAAIYSTSLQLFQTMSNILLQGFNQSSLGLYSKLETEDRKKAFKLYRLNIQMEHLAVTIPMLLLLPILHPFILLYGGEKYSASVQVIQALIVFSLPARILGGGTNTTVLLALNNFDFVLKIRIIFGVMNITTNLLLLHFFPSIISVIIGTNAIGLIMGLLEYTQLRKLEFNNPFLISAKVLLLILPLVMCGYFIENQGLKFIITYCIFSPIYCYLIFVYFKPFERFEHSIENKFLRIYDKISS